MESYSLVYSMSFLEKDCINMNENINFPSSRTFPKLTAKYHETIFSYC